MQILTDGMERKDKVEDQSGRSYLRTPPVPLLQAVATERISLRVERDYYRLSAALKALIGQLQAQGSVTHEFDGARGYR